MVTYYINFFLFTGKTTFIPNKQEMNKCKKEALRYFSHFQYEFVSPVFWCFTCCQYLSNKFTEQQVCGYQKTEDYLQGIKAHTNLIRGTEITRCVQCTELIFQTLNIRSAASLKCSKPGISKYVKLLLNCPDIQLSLQSKGTAMLPLTSCFRHLPKCYLIITQAPAPL